MSTSIPATTGQIVPPIISPVKTTVAIAVAANAEIPLYFGYSIQTLRSELMRVAKFCKRKIRVTEAGKALELLCLKHHAEVDVKVTDCIRRCLECQEKPFCRIQLQTVEAHDAEGLVNKIIQSIHL